MDPRRKNEKRDKPFSGKKKQIFTKKKEEDFVPKEDKTPSDTATTKDTIRLNKYVANAGIASRRKADELIAQGFVSVNGTVIKEMGYRVKPTDEIRFKGQPIKPVEKKVYFLLNKPKNTITTAKDPKGRRTVLDIMEKATDVRIFPVGRLDRDTTGLLLLTNDGDLAKKLAHPSHKVKKIYHVTLDKPLDSNHLSEIRGGLTLDDGLAEVDKVNTVDKTGRFEVVIEIHIGKNRIVRRIFEHFGYTVKKLDRIYYGGLTKKDIPRGKYRPLKQQEVIMLKHFI